MKKCFTSFKELEDLGTACAARYLKKKKRNDSLCFDIEGFIAEELGLTVVYETFAETDASKIGFLSDGFYPLRVLRDGLPQSVVFLKNTIVIEKALTHPKESCRKRFTLAHEAAHYLLELHVPMQTAACFHSDYDNLADYTQEDLQRMFSLNENLTNRLGAAVLMPSFLVAKALTKYNAGLKIVHYGGGVFSPQDKLTVQKVADSMGVSYSAMLCRLKELNLLENRPMDEYLDQLQLRSTV